MYISAKFKTGVKILQNHVQCKVCAFVEKELRVKMFTFNASCFYFIWLDETCISIHVHVFTI